MIKKLMKISSEVQKAIDENRPMIALESTIITHGMPYPENFQTALEVENIIRSYNVTPVTFMVDDGKICVGLTLQELENYSKRNNSECFKLSTRDLPWALQQKKWGSTTVACTIKLAHLMNIKVMVTGGLGGVHRQVSSFGFEGTNLVTPDEFSLKISDVKMTPNLSTDISADLTQLAQTPVAVVCAGIKAILDIGATLELLETLGVPVVGYGCEKFPAFYSSNSPYPVNQNFTDTESLKAFIELNSTLLPGGVVIANPVPIEQEIPYLEIMGVIQRALIDLQERGITGKQVTPYLLSRVSELTEGRSLKTNMMLIKNNAHLGAQLV
jgi:pseudouridine-5'-phosphate glycosidase